MSTLQTPAFLLRQNLSMTVGSRELADLGPDDALVRVQWAGLCGSDLHVMRTGAWVLEWPATLGHEIYGTVEQAPEDGALAPGDAVVADSRIACGRCQQCTNGAPDRCVNVAFVGEACPGGFAELCVLPAEMLHRVPDELRSPVATLSEPLAVIVHALSLLRSEPRRVVILGHGPIGALANVELRRRFADIDIAVAEPAPLRAQLARALGAATVESGGELAEGMYDTVIDAAGYESSLRDAIVLCAPRGQVLLLALSHRAVAVQPADLVERSICVLGANAFVDELPQAISLLAAHPWRYEPIITDAVSLTELPGVARRQLERPEAVKVLVCL